MPIPDGYEFDSFDKLSRKVKLNQKPTDVKERIKTIADIFSDNGISQEEFDANCIGLEQDEVAYRIIKLLAKSLNEGWKPDWSNSNEYKYYPWFYMASSGFRYYVYDYWHSNSIVGSRFCFKTRELAEYAGKQFTEVYKQFMIL